MKIRPLIAKNLLVATLAAGALLLPATAASATQVIPKPGPNQTVLVTYYNNNADESQGINAIGQATQGSCVVDNWGTTSRYYTVTIINC